MSQVLYNTLIQVLMFIGVVYLLGYIIMIINRAFYKAVGAGRTVCLATGFIGTPIHELGHAFMCLVFFHKIVDIKLYQIDDESGTLGYVSHTYNKRNIYHVIGNYFIGVAPIFCGGIVLYLLMKFLLPSSFTAVASSIEGVVASQQYGLNMGIFSELITVFFDMLSGIFLIEFSWKTILFTVLSMCIALHMTLSPADVKGSLGALAPLIILIFLANLVLHFFDGIYFEFLSLMCAGACYLLSFLILGLLFSLLTMILGFIIKLIFKR